MSLTCKLCCFDFDANERIPKILICGHTVCDQCSSKITECPFDRTYFKQNDIKTNYQMVELMNSYSQKHKCKLLTFCQNHFQLLCLECSSQQHKQCSLLNYSSNYYDIVFFLLQKIQQIPEQELDSQVILKQKEEMERKNNQMREEVKSQFLQEYSKLGAFVQDQCHKSFLKSQSEVVRIMESVDDQLETFL